jgi:hypothetical protein
MLPDELLLDGSNGIYKTPCQLKNQLKNQLKHQVQHQQQTPIKQAVSSDNPSRTQTAPHQRQAKRRQFFCAGF